MGIDAILWNIMASTIMNLSATTKSHSHFADAYNYKEHQFEKKMAVFILETYYCSGRTWKTICCSSGYATLA